MCRGSRNVSENIPELYICCIGQSPERGTCLDDEYRISACCMIEVMLTKFTEEHLLNDNDQVQSATILKLLSNYSSTIPLISSTWRGA